MSFSPRRPAPFRLRLLLALLTAAGAGAWMSHAGLMAAMRHYSERAPGERLLAVVELTAAVLDGEIRSAMGAAERAAAASAAAEAIGAYRRGPAAERTASDGWLEELRASSPGMLAVEIADRSGRIAASSVKGRAGADVTARQDFRLGLKNSYVGPPLAAEGRLEYEVSAPVPPRRGDPPGPLGVILARFRLQDSAAANLEVMQNRGARLALARTNGSEFAFLSAGARAKAAGLKSEAAAPFVPALSGREGSYSAKDVTYAWYPVQAAGWVLAAGGGEPSGYPGRAAFGPLARRVLPWAALLAAAAFLAAGALAWGVTEAGKQAAALLEQCGKPVPDPKELAEPEKLASAIAEVSAALRLQAARDIELETEAEKLREEDSDLKSQNDELEKLNRYLAERETRISELKQEISELREKMAEEAAPK